MGKSVLTIPFVTLRPRLDGGFRPRYVAGPRHRRLGFKGEDLRHPDGAWYSLDECLAFSRAREREVAALVEASPKTPRPAPRGYLTVAELAERWLASPRLNGQRVVEGRKEREPLSAGTVEYYRAGVRHIRLLDDGRIWQSPAAAITAAMIANEEKGILHRIEAAHGLYVARCVRAAMSVCYGWGQRQGHVSANPWKGSGYALPIPAPRIRHGEPAEIAQLVKAADLLGLPEIGDAIVLGVWTGQRQADRLSLCDTQFVAGGIEFRQRKKHGQRIFIPVVAPELAARLNAARIRRAGWRVNYPHVVLNEETRAPFARRRYARKFARVRDAAARGILADGTLGPEPAVGTGSPKRSGAGAEGAGERSVGHAWALAPMQSLSDFHDQDLRDTAVTWLARANCTVPNIASITGHSLETINSTLRHYLGLHPDLARTAIGKLVEWFDLQKGEGA